LPLKAAAPQLAINLALPAAVGPMSVATASSAGGPDAQLIVDAGLIWNSVGIARRLAAPREPSAAADRSPRDCPRGSSPHVKGFLPPA